MSEHGEKATGAIR